MWFDIAYRYGVTVTVDPWDSSLVDGGGNPVPGYGDSFQIQHVVFDPGTSYEPPTSGFSRVVTTPTLYLMPGSAAVSNHDRVHVPGNGLFEVDGEPRVWPVGVVVVLKRVSG